VLGLELKQGRTFTENDRRAPGPAAIVNEPFATVVLGGAAVGRTIRVASRYGEYATAAEVTIVGVVAGARERDRNDSRPTVFLSKPLQYQPALALYVRATRELDAVVPALRSTVRQIDPQVPIDSLTTLQQLRDNRRVEQRWLARGVVGLGILALMLAAAGLYGVISYIVSLRVREIGVRIALGAEPGTVLRMVVRQALTPTLIGAALGAGGAAALGAVLRSRLYGVSPVDPVAFAGATALLLVTMVLASLAPARRAARVDPLVVLRHD
jgi:putative ABC transport system permease protein